LHLRTHKNFFNLLRLTYWQSAAVPAPAQYILLVIGSIFIQFLSATISPAVALINILL
jgi:hypothetical protein